jgi:hypothetical protein
LSLSASHTDGYFQLVSEVEAHRDGVWPMGSFDPRRIVFVDDIRPFRIIAKRYRAIRRTFNRYSANERDAVFSTLGLVDEERVTTQYKRRWNQLGFGVRWRATLASGLLQGKRVISLPNYDFAIRYWTMPVVQDIWRHLLEQGCVVLVSRAQSLWLEGKPYPVKVSMQQKRAG